MTTALTMFNRTPSIYQITVIMQTHEVGPTLGPLYDCEFLTSANIRQYKMLIKIIPCIVSNIAMTQE